MGARGIKMVSTNLIEAIKLRYPHLPDRIVALKSIGCSIEQARELLGLEALTVLKAGVTGKVGPKKPRKVKIKEIEILVETKPLTSVEYKLKQAVSKASLELEALQYSLKALDKAINDGSMSFVPHQNHNDDFRSLYQAAKERYPWAKLKTIETLVEAVLPPKKFFEIHVSLVDVK